VVGSGVAEGAKDFDSVSELVKDQDRLGLGSSDELIEGDFGLREGVGNLEKEGVGVSEGS
jgi:hypothetical protein